MSINKADIEANYPGAKMYEPMLINKIPKGKESMLSSICSDGKYFGQLKKDGYFYQFEKSAANASYLFSRNKGVNGLLSEKGANVPHIIEALSPLPAETIIIGEVYYPGGTSKNVTEIMGCLSAKAIERQKQKGLIHFYIYDIIYYDGYNLLNTGAEMRYKILEKIYKEYNLDSYDFLELAITEYDDLEDKINSALANGEEGMVLKSKDGVYSPGKRPAWVSLKIKQSDTVDAIITGFCAPTREYTGKEIESWEYWEEKAEDNNWIKCKGLYHEDYLQNPRYYRPITKHYYFGWNNAIEVSAYDKDHNLQKIGTISSGLTDDMRTEITDKPNLFLGKVCKIQCMSLDSTEKTIRHGFFKGLHTTKNPDECTIENIF